MLGALVGAGVLPLKEVVTATLEAAVEEEGEDGQLVDGGSAWKLVGAVLQAVAQNSNQAQMSKQWRDTGVELDAFFPSVRDSNYSSNTGRARQQASIQQSLPIRCCTDMLVGLCDCCMTALTAAGDDTQHEQGASQPLTLAVMHPHSHYT